MNINIEEVRQQMQELHRRELEGLEVFAGALERARKCGLALPVTPRSATVLLETVKPRAAAKAPAGRPATNRKGQRGAVLAMFETVVTGLAEPFTVASGKEAFLQAHPELEDWAVQNIAATLQRWHTAGLLERTAGGGGPGKPSSYRRTKKWGAAEGGRSPKERAYLEFRSSIATPKTDET